MIVDIVGYAASAFVAISIVMTSMRKLRYLNLTGAILFVVYGIFIGAIPVVITNGFIALVNIYRLWEDFRSPKKNEEKQE